MRPRTYKTNRLLWLTLSLMFFLLCFYGIDFISDLFSGRIRMADLLSFELIYPVVASIVMGWLLQCAIVIVFHWTGRKGAIIVVALALLILLCPVVFRKRTVPIVSDGRVVAVAKRPFAFPWSDNEFGVYVGKSKVFSLWGDIFDVPLFIYPFRDGQRFLCIYDYDVEDFAFVVDFSASATNTSRQTRWPSYDASRATMAAWATNVVLEAKGVARLPSYAELQEASSGLASLTSKQFRATSFPLWDAGIYRSYALRESLLVDLQTNREF